jgi:hypothetical protein
MWSFFLALSYHLGSGNYVLNSVHPHVRYTTESGYIAGAYYNSESNISLYYGKQYGNLELALVTGYADIPVLPYARYKYDGFFVAPAVYEDKGIGAVLGYEIGF